MVSMEIDTGDTPPRWQPPRRMPFSMRKEVCKIVMGDAEEWRHTAFEFALGQPCRTCLEKGWFTSLLC